jgi:hypothetical protein
LIDGSEVMKKVSLFQISKALSAKIKEISFIRKARKVPTAFTRSRKMPFCDIISFIISCANKSLQAELDEYFQSKGSESVSRQAFSKKREDLNHEAFIDLNDVLVSTFEDEDGEKAAYRGYRLFSADGTLIDLPNTEKLRERFGYSSNGTDKVYAKGLAITAFDVLNKITVFAELYRYDDSEKRRMLEIADGFARLYNEKSIWLLDRGYPSFELFSRFEQNSQNYVVRVSTQSLKEINAASEADQVVEITRNSTSIKVRVANVLLSSGETEKLATNLPSSFTTDDLKELYGKRWGVETNYMFLKCKAFLEVFTGESEAAVLQDFHASILVLNMAAIAEREQEDVLRKNSAVCKSGKHEGCQYRPNKTKLIRDIKRDFVKLLLCENMAHRVFRQFLLYQNIKRYAFLDVPGRSFKRNFVQGRSCRTTHPKSGL